jgi:hypothetical protein
MNDFPRMEEELAGINLGDERLNRRAISIAQRAVEGPGKSFPKMVKDASELEAFYRFFQNEQVEPKAILEPHRRATVARCNELPLVRVAHDTTAFTFHGERDGLGKVNRGRGFHWHASLAISGDELRAPLGVVAASAFTVKEVKKEARAWMSLKRLRELPEPPPTPKIPRQERLSNRWFEAVQEVEALHSSARIIHVMDREADDFTLMAQMQAAGIRFVIRVKATRRLGQDLSYNIDDRLQCARTHLIRSVPLCPRKVPDVMPQMRKYRIYQPRDERTATLHVRATRITLPRPPAAETEVSSLTVNVVQVFEPQPPPGEQPVEWTLLTTEPIGATEEIEAIVDHYRARWRIEELFKALKSGCAIERRQLTDLDGLLRALSFFAMIAWRLLAMRVLARADSTIRASTLFDAQDVAVVRFLAHRRKHALSPEPTMREVMLAFASIGGHLKRNGEPGWMTIGRGYDDFCLAREVWISARNTCDQS